MNFIDEKGFNDQQGALDQLSTSTTDPSFMAGSAGALFNGAANGFSQIASQAAEAGYDSGDSAMGELLGLNTGAPRTAETIRENAKWASDTLKPDPQTTGTMAQILFGVGDVGARFAVGLPLGGPAGGALTSGLSVGDERYNELIDQGVDPKTALGTAAIRGITTGAGALLPGGIGSSLLTRVASGVGINVAAGAGGRAAESQALQGYKQGDEIKAFRAQDVAVDAILGGIFGGVSKLGVDVSHDQFDAALTLKNAKSANLDTLPGDPVSVGDIARHSALMDKSIDDILNDRPVSVDAQSGGVKFKPREAADGTPVEQTGLAADDLSPYQRNTLRASEVTDDELGIMATGDALSRLGEDTQQSYADIVRSAFEEEGYGRVYAEMTRSEENAAQINRSQSQFAPEEVQDVPSLDDLSPARAEPAPLADRPAVPDAAPSRAPEDTALPADGFDIPNFDIPEPETRPVVTSKQGTEWLDTRGMGETLHGSPFEVNPNNTHYTTMNIYGQGFYTTDAADIAEGYSRKGKGGTPTVYRVKVNGDPKMLDMENSIPPDVHAMVKDVLGDIYPHEVLDTGKPPENLREVYNEVRAESESNGLSADDVQEYFDSIRHNLEKEGYRGFAHVGGLGTNNKAHSVKIFWHPEDDVKLTKLGDDELKPGWQAQEERQIPTEFGKTESATDVMSSADQAVTDASTEGKAYDAAVDCFLSRGN